ncbi:galectin-1-like [Latimeria chalumnae]|uniref:galectin-1-like n=1 Tax=Latimeria chalumnae TaxID=7897 RepID=UPI0006D8FCF7|nr:PREDICTED: galectin-1-like [Latimeria chalumnae]|eukprot:XP_014339760.1 PREDICTED: galectin-1-like [Latimeria chalumnae]
MAPLKLVFTNMKIKHEDEVKFKFSIPEGAKSFTLKAGQDRDNLAVCLEAKFAKDGQGGEIFTSYGKTEPVKYQGKFPFKRGHNGKAKLDFKEKEIEVELTNDVEIKIPNDQNLQYLQYVELEGDIKLKLCEFD